MRSPVGGTTGERDETIRRALVRAAEVPLRIADEAANAATLAASVAERGSQAVRGDAAVAALLSAAAARAAANLVAINLAAGTEQELVARARDVAEDAADSVRWVLDL
jgi:methenyltetrahydrofolate cyclohydrolase